MNLSSSREHNFATTSPNSATSPRQSTLRMPSNVPADAFADSIEMEAYMNESSNEVTNGAPERPPSAIGSSASFSSDESEAETVSSLPVPVPYPINDNVSSSNDAAIAAALSESLPPHLPQRGRNGANDRRRSRSLPSAPSRQDVFQGQQRTAMTGLESHLAETTAARRGSSNGSIVGNLNLQSRRNKEGSLMNKMFGNVVSRAPNRVPPVVGGEGVNSVVDAVFAGLEAALVEDARSDDGSRRGSANEATGSNEAVGLRIYPRTHDGPCTNYPIMTPFQSSPQCAMCNGTFAVFRRPHHCRNCGCCICQSCATTWNSKSLPVTYNTKSEKQTRVCISCDWIANTLMQSLLGGRVEESWALCETKNVNLTCVFPKKMQGGSRGEIVCPIHCAVLGGSLEALRWLVEEQLCPIFQPQTQTRTPILTSKGRSVLTLAVQKQNVDIVRYLVVEKGMSLNDCKGVQTGLLGILEKALRRIPEISETTTAGSASLGNSHFVSSALASSEQVNNVFVDVPDPVAQSTNLTAALTTNANDDENCIICFERSIDCVITPCGHQVCCLSCGERLRSCPVCNNQDCAMLRIFKI